MLQRAIAHPNQEILSTGTLYLPRLRVLKDRYMCSSCKGVNSVILGDGQHLYIPEQEQPDVWRGAGREG